MVQPAPSAGEFELAIMILADRRDAWVGPSS